MKIGEAQQLYREQVKAYQEQKSLLSKQMQDIKSRLNSASSEHDKQLFN